MYKRSYGPSNASYRCNAFGTSENFLGSELLFSATGRSSGPGRASTHHYIFQHTTKLRLAFKKYIQQQRLFPPGYGVGDLVYVRLDFRSVAQLLQQLCEEAR